MTTSTKKPQVDPRLKRAREAAMKEWGGGWRNLTPEMRKAYVALHLVGGLAQCDKNYPFDGADVLGLFDSFVRGED
jgi:hypothetical protein